MWNYLNIREWGDMTKYADVMLTARTQGTRTFVFEGKMSESRKDAFAIYTCKKTVNVGSI